MSSVWLMNELNWNWRLNSKQTSQKSEGKRIKEWAELGSGIQKLN